MLVQWYGSGRKDLLPCHLSRTSKNLFNCAGVGKGLVGVVTRPASGVVDFASTSFDGLKRAAENINEARRVRPPRFLHKDGILRPYIHVEAEGNDILQVNL